MQSVTQQENREQPPAKKSLWTLFWVMFKIGAFTFGGGWSIVAQVDREFVQKRGWITSQELVDFTTVGRSLPGVMVINTAVLFGRSTAGIIGALVAAVGVAMPSVITIAVITVCYDAVAHNPLVARAMRGVRAAVIPIILGALFSLRKASLVNRFSYLVAAAAFVVSLFTGVSAILVVASGAALGLLLRGGRGRDLP
ncbi:chromate transporter [Feifania hominis]|uniref:chromate transporter n=1 Tax=Feifania hominis TaxID=2763660 RepID=UPI0020163FF7